MSGASGDRAQPSLRERNRERTRRAILDAVAEIELLRGGVLDQTLFTYANIAEVAGVSERTVYRMFPTKADLDRAYVADAPVAAGVAEPESLDDVPEMIREVTRTWSRRGGSERIEEHEPGWEDYPSSMEARRGRDRDLRAEIDVLLARAEGLSDRQRLAITAAVHSTYSVRTIATAAQRWGLTLEEAGEGHAWVLETLIEALHTKDIEPWEDVR